MDSSMRGEAGGSYLEFNDVGRDKALVCSSASRRITCLNTPPDVRYGLSERNAIQN